MELEMSRQVVVANYINIKINREDKLSGEMNYLIGFSIYYIFSIAQTLMSYKPRS